jgi:hypothetical protein
MAKKIFAVVVICAMACALIGATYSEAKEEPAKTVFFDASAIAVDGCDAESENLWMLGNGEYTVRYHNGTQRQLVVEDGSWYIIN